jgi:hypothetical protein
MLSLFINHPMTWDFGHWTGSSSAILLLVLLGIAFYGFRVSLGGQSLIRDDTLTG